MPEGAIPAYPDRYTPGTLDLDTSIRFEARDGRTFRLPETGLVAGTCGTWIVEITNRECDLPAGARLTLVRMNCQIAFKLQTDRPRARDYCTLETDSDASLRLLGGRSAVNLLTVAVEAGVFKKGEACRLRIGDRRSGSVGSEVFWSATTGQFLLAVDLAGDGGFVGVRGNPYPFSVVAHPEVKLLRLLGPTVVRVGEPFALHFGAFDRNRNVVDTYSGEIGFNVPEGIEGMPTTYSLSRQDQGLAVFRSVRIAEPGVYRISFQAEGVEGFYLSNPIVAQEAPKAHVYWGDVHAHGWGDSTMHLMHLRTEKLDPLSRHRQAREVGRLDFACPGAMSMDPDRRAEVWSAYVEACAQMDEPGRYVPFLSYEAHTRDGGDRQIIFRDYQNEPIPLDMRDPIAKVDSTYGAREDVLMEVHIGGRPPRWHVYRPRRERFLEVCSGFGCAEWLLQKALRLGYRPAVCGASDLHLGLMGGPRAVETFRGRFGYTYPMRQRDSGYGTGPLTAIRAERLTRDDLWQAIQARGTYATSGARIYLDVTCNGYPSGSELVVGDSLSIDITCHACAPLDRIDLIVGPYRQHSWYPAEMDFHATLELPTDDIAGSWLYIRAHQVDGEYAWSSPFWLTGVSTSESADLPAWNADDLIDLRTVGSSKAAHYLPDLMQYLETEEDADRFRDLTPVDVIEQSTGTCALFYCYWGDEGLPMSIRWFYEFEIPKVRYDFGWQDYGAYDEVGLAPKLAARYED